MTGKSFEADRLAKLLAPWRFVLNLPETKKGGISFVRSSSVERLYEHILISPGKTAYAEAVLSGASFTSCHACVSEKDNRFRAFLSEDSTYQTSMLTTWADANAWQAKLVENADAYCSLMASDSGPVLSRRLAPVFNSVRGYERALGDIFAIFDREFAYVTGGPSDEQAEVNRLANLASSMLWLNSEDAKLASVALVRFGSEVEQHSSPFRDKLPHRDDGLAARLILLADYVRTSRLDYGVANGMSR